MIELTCIVCPKGCRLQVDDENGYTVTGNSCPRGAAYGHEEATSPTRMVTSTVRILFVKTAAQPFPVTKAHPEESLPELPEFLPLVSYFDPASAYIEARLPVKTGTPVAKTKIMEVMKEIKRVTVYAPIHIGDIIISNIANTGIDLIATRNMETIGM